MKVVFILLAVAAMAVLVLGSPLTEQQYEGLFVRFVASYNKAYQSKDFFHRYNTFKSNLAKIIDHNSDPYRASYTLAMNEFGDLTSDEFKAKFTGLRIPSKRSVIVPERIGVVTKRADPVIPAWSDDETPVDPAIPAWSDDEVPADKPPADEAPSDKPPAEFDWRDHNAVTPVKNQGQCGSCWAFSATMALEGAWAAKTGQLLNLSEQHLVDCSSGEGNQGCNGGLMDNSFRWIVKNGGICTTADYPYNGRDDSACNKNCQPAFTISDFRFVTPKDEDELLTAVAEQPVSISIEASGFAFQFYSGGVLDSGCGTAVDHGVGIVGYGTDNGKDYWTVRNSWGPNWGEGGYIRIGRGSNMCGLATNPVYPLVMARCANWGR